MKKILVFYYNEELRTDSNTSVTRLVASLTEGLSAKYEMHYFVFGAVSYINCSNPVFLKVPVLSRLKRKINNTIGLKRMHWQPLKRKAAIQYLQRIKHRYDAVLVLGLDDVKYVRKYFPDSIILYWIHNISAICKKEYLYSVNDADYFLSPSRTTYKLLLQKLQPVPLTAEFCFFPNWCEDIFKQRSSTLVAEIKRKHGIEDHLPVFIFSGSDLRLKGRFIIEKVIKKLASSVKREVLFLFAGGRADIPEYCEGCIKVINVGLLSPEQLAAYYHVAQFGCFASLGYDHCPLTLLEMINCGVMPIASDVGSVKEIVGENHLFLVDEPHSVSNWTEVIESALLINAEERARLVGLLKKRINDVYDRNKAFKIIEEIV